MTEQTDERRRQREQGHSPTSLADPNETLTRVTMWLSARDPESLMHQVAACALHQHRKDGGPVWADLPRKDRVPFYSLTESLFGG